MATIAARSWNRFVVRNLSVVPKLLGAEHEFNYRGKNVTLLLPDLERKADGTLKNDEVLCHSWQKVNGKEIPLEYSILSVDLFVDVEGNIEIPDQALQMPPVQHKLFSKELTSQLNSKSTEHEAIAKAAIQHWMRMLRWKTRIPYVGEPEIAREESGWATFLVASQSNHRFWSPGHRLTARRYSSISEIQWAETQLALKTKIDPPVWFHFIFEALQRLVSQDTVAAVLSAAIALELIMRGLLARHLSNESAAQQIVTTVLDQANLRLIMNHRKKMALWNTEWEKKFDNSAFDQLMNSRDAIMHRGEMSVLSTPDWHKVFCKLLDFAYFVEEKNNK